MKAIAVQFDIAWENKSANFRRVRELIAAAGPEEDSLIVLPELFASGFSMNTDAIADAYGGETEQFLAGLAREFRVCLISGVAIRGRDNAVRNKALVFSPAGELLAFYAKMRPFTPGGESQHYTAGERGVAFRLGEWIISPFICYDLRFPELFRRVAAEHRPELFAVIANWPDKRIHHWVRLLQARAIENQAYVVGVNRTGTDPNHVYTGRSLIIDPHGEIIADAGDGEGVVVGNLNLAMLREYRRALPFLDDMRLDKAGA